MAERDWLQIEWLTAMFDGEEPRDERRVADDGEASRMWEEWRELSDSMRALPSYSLPAGFADEVWHAAEAERSAQTPVSGHRAAWRITLTLMGTAAALLIAFGIVRWQADRATDSSRVPGMAASPSENSREVQPGGEYVAQEAPLPTVGRYLLVIDVTLTEKAIKSRAFEQALRQFGIEFDASIQANRKLEQALLASRFLTPATEKKADVTAHQQQSKLDLIYVTAPARSLDAMIPFLKQQPDLYPQVKLDMAQKPEQLRVFEQLRLASQAVLASTDSPAHAHRVILGATQRHSGWRRLTLPVAMIPLTLISTEGSHFDREDQQPTPDATAPTPPATGTELKQKLESLANMQAEALFILRLP